MKKELRFLIVFLLLVAAFIGVYSWAHSDAVSGEKTITVDVVHGDGSVRNFTYHTSAEFLGEVLLKEGLVKGTQGLYGLYITEVDGERAVYEEDDAYWALFQNDKPAVQGADLTPIVDGDVFALIYTVS